MLFLYRVLVGLSAVGSLVTAEPVLTADLADTHRSRQRFAGSLLATIWHSPALARPRGALQGRWRAAAEPLAKAGIALEAVAAAITAGGLVVDELRLAADGPQARLQAYLTAPGQATVVRDLAALAELEAVLPTGAAEATWQLEDGFEVSLVGDSACLTSEDRDPQPPPVVDTPADLAVVWRGEPLHTFLRAAIAADEGPDTADVLAALVPGLADGRWLMALTADGLAEELVLDAPLPFLVPIQESALASLPQAPLLALAFGLDVGPAWRDGLGARLIRAIAAAEGQSGPEVRAWLDEQLAGIGAPQGADAFVDGLRGTFVLVVLPGAPFPSVNLVIPQTPATEALLGRALADLGAPGLADDAPALQVLETPLPVAVRLARRADAWLVSSDPAFPEHWLTGAEGGFLGAPLADAVGDLADGRPALGLVIDLANSAMVANAWVTLATIGAERRGGGRPTWAEVASALLPLLQAEARPITVGLENGSDRAVVRSRGLVTPVAAGVIAAFGLIATSQPRAQTAVVATGSALENQLAQVFFAAFTYVAEEGAAPASLEALRRWSTPPLPAGLLRVSGADHVPGQHLCYVPFATRDGLPEAGIPLVVVNPDCLGGSRTVACMAADGRIVEVPGRRLWDHAQGLARGRDGRPASAADWAPVADLLAP